MKFKLAPSQLQVLVADSEQADTHLRQQRFSANAGDTRRRLCWPNAELAIV